MAYRLHTHTGMLLSSAIHTSQFVRTDVALLSCRGPGGQPSVPHRAQKEQCETLRCEGSKNGVGVTSFCN